MSLRDQYLGIGLGSPGLAAAHLASDLHRDDSDTLKQGYSIPNALLAALEIFPEATEASIRRLNDWVDPFAGIVDVKHNDPWDA